MVVTFHVATSADEGDIRRLLRENAIGGRYAMSLEREPDGFAGHLWPGERKAIVLAREGANGSAVGLAERIVRPAFVDGRPCLLPYLGALRIAASHRGRIGILKGGFDALRAVVRRDELPFALTSITADNTVARRVLTSGLANLPHYSKVADYTTLVLAPLRARWPEDITPATDTQLADVAAFLNSELARFQFAPVWSEQALRNIGPTNVLVQWCGGKIVGTAAVWDQSALKQTVAREYPLAIAITRTALNALAPLIRRPLLPRIGEPLALMYVSALASRSDDPAMIRQLIKVARDHAARRGAGAVVIGADSRRAWLPLVQRPTGSISYHTELFCVHDDTPSAHFDASQLTHPDVGLM